MRWLTGLIIILGLIISMSPDLRVIEKQLVVHHEKIVYKSVYEYQRNFKYDVPDEQAIRNMDILANQVLAPIERHFQKIEPSFKLHLTSFCRDWSKGSEHVEGKAADWDIDGMYECITNLDIAQFIYDSLYFNQLIIYNSYKNPAHGHVSFDDCKNKNETKFCRKRRGRRPRYKEITL